MSNYFLFYKKSFEKLYIIGHTKYSISIRGDFQYYYQHKMTLQKSVKKNK